MFLRNFEKKIFLIFAVICFGGVLLNAQNLDCKVEVISQKVTGVDRAVFNTLQQNLTDILNSTDWATQSKSNKQGKIPCTFILTIDKKTEGNTYEGSLQVQANRLVFNSSYATPLLNHKDKKVVFSFLPSQSLTYAKAGKNNELVAIIAYYAYLIVGLDEDSFSNKGGTWALKKAQKIVLEQGGASLGSGWSATERTINRYWIIEDLLTYEDLRETSYLYHRKGLDFMVANPKEGLKNMVLAIRDLEQVYKKSSNVTALHVFFDAKAKEIAQSFSVLPQKERKKIHSLLEKIAPGHLVNFKGLE